MVSSCVSEYNDGKDNRLTQTHGYDSDDSRLSSKIGDVDLDEAIRDRENPDRNNWQKPKEVIRRLGDLRGKTIADIGAGYGYFTIQFLYTADKVIAIDIDPSSIAFIDSLADTRYKDMKTKLETRLVKEDNPSLNANEVDIVFISNTYTYLENKVDYLKTVYQGMKPKGRIYIVDFKMKKLPAIFPAAEIRTPLFEVENHLEEAGFRHLFSDDQTLDYQYIVIAEKE